MMYEFNFYSVVQALVGMYRLVELTKLNCNLQGVLFDTFSYCFSHRCDVYDLATNVTSDLYSFLSSLGDLYAAILVPEGL